MNGNIRTCYEYYSSIGDEEMQAKYDSTSEPGTEKNPYALEDALDWCNVPSVYTIDIPYPYFEVIKDIDMNDCNKQTIESAVIERQLFNFTKIEGNGHCIRNLSAILQNVYNKNSSMMYIKSTNTSLRFIINNLNFVNIIRYDSFTSLFNFSSLSGNIIFNNCNFTIYDYNRNCTSGVTSFSIFNTNTTIRYIFNYCTFNIKCSLMYNAYSTTNTPHQILSNSINNTFNYCHINIEYMHGINPSGVINSGTYNFSYITLIVNYLGQDDKTNNFTYNLFSAVSNSIDYWHYYLRGSYIYIKFKSNTTIDRTNDNNTVGGPFLKLCIPGCDPTYEKFSYDYIALANGCISRTTVPSFITIEDENKDDPNKYIDISELTHFKPADISDDGVFSINSNSSTLYYLTPENAKNYDILSKIDFPCLKV